MIDFIEKFKATVKKIEYSLSKDNYRACSNFSSDIIRASEINDFPEGVFIGEGIDSIFDNVESIDSKYNLESSDKDEIKKSIIPLLKTIHELIPTQDSKSKSGVYDQLVASRYFTTKLQLKYLREIKPKDQKEPPFQLHGMEV